MRKEFIEMLYSLLDINNEVEKLRLEVDLFNIEVNLAIKQLENKRQELIKR